MIEGTEYGPRTAEIGNWVGKAIYSNRASLPKILKRTEFDNPGIYCLKSIPVYTTYSERIYIGEAENIGTRIKQHLNETNKDFDEFIFFISKDDFLTKAHVKYLEAKIIEMAHDAKSAEIINVHKPTYPVLHEAEISDLEYFLEQIKLILPVMGFKFLVPTVIREQEKETSLPFKEFYTIKHISISAKMYEDALGFIVTKGSMANKNMVPSVSDNYKSLQKRLIESGILVDNGKYFSFSEDTVFSSPSSAANIVLGRQTPGPLLWLSKDGRTFKELHD
ncbi:MAG: hypothetical protein JWN56_958 [Sphingobacteriales bacterium]|nr:hypothetical protein [Sphingobacteriales bacterium]